MIVVGVDPGTRTGIAIFEDGKLVETMTCSSPNTVEALTFLILAHPDEPLVFVVECSYLLKARFRAKADKSGWGIRKADQNAMEIVASLKQTERLLRLIDEYDMPVSWQITVAEIPPPQHGNRISKVRPTLFQAIFPEYEGRTSEHARDAATLAAWWIQQQKVNERITNG